MFSNSQSVDLDAAPSAADIDVGGKALQDALEAIREHAHGNAPADLLTDCLASPKDALSSLEDL
jgi:hypothetical protein